MNTTEMAFIVAAPQAPRIWCQTAVTTRAPVQSAHQVGATRRYQAQAVDAGELAWRHSGGWAARKSPQVRRQGRRHTETSSCTGEDGALGRRDDPLGIKRG